MNKDQVTLKRTQKMSKRTEGNLEWKPSEIWMETKFQPKKTQ